MKVSTALFAGLAGACALNIVHQALKKADEKAPHVDELGMEALSTSLDTVGVPPPEGKKLFYITLAGDIISNTVYYSLAAIGGRRNRAGRATFLGLLAGMGAVYLPKQMHLNPAHTGRTSRTQYLTMGLYTFGGAVAGIVMQLLSIGDGRKNKMKQVQAPKTSR